MLRVLLVFSGKLILMILSLTFYKIFPLSLHFINISATTFMLSNREQRVLPWSVMKTCSSFSHLWGNGYHSLSDPWDIFKRLLFPNSHLVTVTLKTASTTYVLKSTALKSSPLLQGDTFFQGSSERWHGWAVEQVAILNLVTFSWCLLRVHVVMCAENAVKTKTKNPQLLISKNSPSHIERPKSQQKCNNVKETHDSGAGKLTLSCVEGGGWWIRESFWRWENRHLGRGDSMCRYTVQMCQC